MICENGLCFSFKGHGKIQIGSKNGKPHYVNIHPQDYVDFDVKTGKFFVKDKFTHSKMKMVDPTTDVHVMEFKRVKGFVESLKSNKDVRIIDG